MSSAWQVVTTIDSSEVAERIARVLVDQRLAACVQVEGPILSVYRWKGAIETAREWRCVIKTTETLFPAVSQAIRQQHPYDVPEIVATAIVGVSDDYRDWLLAQLGPTAGRPME